MRIPTKIRAIRMMNGITQEEVAAAVGITVGTVSKYERNGVVPPKHMKKYAEAIHCDFDTLWDIFYQAMQNYYDGELANKEGDEE